jgi:hypothetical protein
MYVAGVKNTYINKTVNPVPVAKIMGLLSIIAVEVNLRKYI